ncbi:hypothetical protein BDW71DRAFT_213595 [Aspergillus fruticulosus]
MATRKILFLTTSQVQGLHARYVLDAIPTQPNLLASPVYSPKNMKQYTNEEDVFQLAANLAEKIMKIHTFMDGNKRTALVAADMFLEINGYILRKTPFAEDLHNRALANAHVSVVTNQWTAAQLGNFYKSVAVPVREAMPAILEYKSAATEY